MFLKVALIRMWLIANALAGQGSFISGRLLERGATPSTLFKVISTSAVPERYLQLPELHQLLSITNIRALPPCSLLPTFRFRRGWPFSSSFLTMRYFARRWSVTPVYRPAPQRLRLLLLGWS